MKKILSFIAIITLFCLMCSCKKCNDTKTPDNQYTVTFKDYDEKILKEEVVQEGYSATAPENPEREYYNFIGWDSDFANVTKNLEIHAKYEAIEYPITYILNGGTNDENNPTTYTIEDSITLKDPTKEGYDFVGWVEGNSNEIGSTGNKTFTATWKAIEYPITYVLNGGTNDENNPTTYTIEDSITLEDPTKEGYDFVGWYTDAALTVLTNPIIEKGTKGELTFYAKWEVSGYTFEDNGTGVTIVATDSMILTGDVEIPETFNGLPVTKIGDSAFKNNIRITNIIIPNTVTSIGKSAFYECKRLENITIPDNVTEIGAYAFYNCISLEKAKIGIGVKTIYEHVFYYCKKLKEIEVDQNNLKYKSIDGNLYTKNGTTLIQYALGKEAEKFVIPNTVKSIMVLAFAKAYNLKTVVVSDGVETIGYQAFKYCLNLESIIISDSVKLIAGGAFYGCSKLTIYCKIKDEQEKPEKWVNNWNGIIFDAYGNPTKYAEVIWGYEAEAE